MSFGWSISGWERNNKLITKVVYRYQNGSRNSILVDLNWSSDNSDKMINLVVELAELMQERNVDLSKAGPDPQGRDINLGDSIVGSVAGLIYNASWLDYAISNEGCWLIFINWFLACIGIWLFVGYTITNRFLKR